MLFRFLMLVFVCAAFPLKCPEPAQWSIRARGHCPDPTRYSCLKNDLSNGYSENCTIFNFLKSGRKNVLRGGLDADICSPERYHPWSIKFQTNVSTNCLFLKTKCNEEGQVVYSPENRTTDITCSCDYTRGYNFLVKPRDSCFCVPSEEDCSCIVKTCTNSTYKLSPDYKCIHIKKYLPNAQCKTRIQERSNTTGNDSNPKYTPRRENIPISGKWKMHGRIPITGMLIGLIPVLCIYALIAELLDRYFWEVYFIREPLHDDILLIEGQNVSIRYKLSRKTSPIIFFKNDQIIAEPKNVIKRVSDRWNILEIVGVTIADEGEYCAKVKGKKSTVTRLVIQPIFTSNIDPIYCIEGGQIQLSCSVYTDNIKVKWYKEECELHHCDNISIRSHENHRTLVIARAEIKDSGMFYVKAENVQMQIRVVVKAFFGRPLTNITIMEGLDIRLECETEGIIEGVDTRLGCEAEENYNVQWFKDGVEIIVPSNRITIAKPQGRFHSLNISQASLKDKGNYRITIKGISSSAVLDVKEMPETIKHMAVHDREQFLKAAKSGTKKRYYIRVMIVGESSAGKTCLLRRLMHKNIDDVESTDSLDIHRRTCKIDVNTGDWHFSTAHQTCCSLWSKNSEQFADCGFWDFAGQKQFYATHQTFLTGNAVYLLVVDISKDVTAKTYNHMIEKQFDIIGEYIDFWFDNIHCYCTEPTQSTELNPPIIVVGTGLDNIPLENREDTRRTFENFLSELLSSHAKRRHLRKQHYLSNTCPSEKQQEFKKLREDIFNTAQSLTKWCNNLPISWIVLEKEICRKICGKEYIMSYSEALDLAMKCSFPDIRQQATELESFLKYEHDIGNIIFFEDLKDFIILDLKWLVNILKCFVSHEYKSETLGMPEWTTLEQTGKLLDELIDELLKKVASVSLKLHKNYILQILQKFDIIVKPIDNSTMDYYMPCMINAVPFNIIIKKNISDDWKKTSWFGLKFNFLPPTFFNHILVSFIRTHKVFKEKDSRLSIYNNIGIFQLNTSGSQILVICLSKYSIAMQVLQLECREDICFVDVKNQLLNLVDSIKLRYRINLTYEKKFKCPNGSFHDNEGICYDEVIDKNEFRCSEHNEMHSSKDIYTYWLKKEEVEEERKSRCEEDRISSVSAPAMPI